MAIPHNTNQSDGLAFPDTTWLGEPIDAAFAAATYAGHLAPAGIRFHEFESDGRGEGIEVEVTVTGAAAARVVIVRLR